MNSMTFGQAITQARKALGITQRQLVARVFKEDGHPISLPYLVDIEHDRRKPSSDHLIKQFATALDMPPEFLYFLAKRIPSDMAEVYSPRAVNSANYKRVVAAYNAFRKELKRGAAA